MSIMYAIPKPNIIITIVIKICINIDICIILDAIGFLPIASIPVLDTRPKYAKPKTNDKRSIKAASR